jgi:uncharacterized protein YecT (DUF1311 family)
LQRPVESAANCGPWKNLLIYRSKLAGHSIFGEGKVLLVKVTAFLALALSYTMAGAADLSFSPCSEASSHVEQRSCLESLFKETEARLARAEESTLAKLGVWDEEPEYRSVSRKALLASSSAFRMYRTSQCDYVWSLAAGGNGATDMKLSCAIELTESRIKQLEAYSTGLGKR